MHSVPEDSTDRLHLCRPLTDDAPGLYAILSDPRVWEHYPSLRNTAITQTKATLERWMRGWDADGIGTWIVREHGSDAIVGYGGLSLRGGLVWNLGYRFAPEAQGRGLATELGRRALERAARLTGNCPVIAYLLEENAASGAVAEKLGLQLVDGGQTQETRTPRRCGSSSRIGR
ncbi:GNAT family N-acetyltransferase [Mycetocola zhujimingii]|uniref:GNAT family N-acetyltransferase n=1 Tax=Mycetocola zhujimingii TaxID=2079792 RepID=UPI001F21ED12|nr:GNAT family N-acetyltransferase [Mycetocola zhujimingii]